jgi:hypothetical protein
LSAKKEEHPLASEQVNEQVKMVRNAAIEQ